MLLSQNEQFWLFLAVNGRTKSPLVSVLCDVIACSFDIISECPGCVTRSARL